MTIIELADELHELLKRPSALRHGPKSLIDVEVRVLDRDSEVTCAPEDAEALPVVARVEVHNHVNGGKVVLLRTE